MKDKLYPIYYNGKKYKKEDVNDVFGCFYHSKDSLDDRMSVYVGDGMRITPNGDWVE